jgi:hypothetical protein
LDIWWGLARYMEFEESVVKAEEDTDLIWVTPFQ